MFDIFPHNFQNNLILPYKASWEVSLNNAILIVWDIKMQSSQFEIDLFLIWQNNDTNIHQFHPCQELEYTKNRHKADYYYNADDTALLFFIWY